MKHELGRVKRLWYLSPMRAAKDQASLRIRTVSPEPPLLAHTSSESKGTFRQKARSLAPLNGWACAVNICHDGMLEDTNSLDAPQFISQPYFQRKILQMLVYGFLPSVTNSGGNRSIRYNCRGYQINTSLLPKDVPTQEKMQYSVWVSLGEEGKREN